MLLVALEENRLDDVTDPGTVLDPNDARTREERLLVDGPTPLADVPVPGHEHHGCGCRPRDRARVTLGREHDEIRPAEILADVGVARKVVCNLYTFTDYTYFLTHEFPTGEEK